jgi:DNA invertase Pin-like site-specific DNA recombinase
MFEKERRMIGTRTREVLAAAKARGVRLGGLRAKGAEYQRQAAERAQALAPVMAELSGLSHRAAAAELNARGIATAEGGKWHAPQVARVRARL